MGQVIMGKNTLIFAMTSLISYQVWAGSVTIPNTFVDGTTASAGEVNDNYTAIESAVNDNDTRITNNATSISNNTADIQSNATNISTNAAGIITNASGISSNATNISSNVADIQTNTFDIQTNAVNISINEAGVTSNANDISTNAADIQANTGSISALASSKPISVFIDGTKVGALLNINSVQANTYNPLTILLPSTYFVMTQDSAASNAVLTSIVFYKTADCTGQAYIKPIGADFNVSNLLARQGLLFTKEFTNPVEYYYLAANTAMEGFTGGSWWFASGCDTVFGYNNFYKVYPNDPAVTGIAGAEFVGTVTLGY